ncbi:MAG: GvpL/GvpF family gas vesicle protein [Candidatus Omnitrophica bacterium]|nr:GvpL/GvpF family gas vesicle protein [Candidatus Omnitrophota bacterium]
MKIAGKYIYGVINSNEKLFFGPHGVSACEEVYTVSYQDIAAVVSDSAMIDCTHMRKEVLAMFLVRHQKAIEKIMSSGHTIIPMRLGTFAQDEAETKYVLACGHTVIKDIFSKISNAIEIDITATFNDFNSAIKEASEDEEIKEFKERLLANPKAVTVDDQMKVGLMVKEALDRIREGYSKRIQASLKNVSHNFKAHELMDDKMVANIAFLMDKAKHKDFEMKVERLNIEFNEKLNFRCVGPLPPYSFYTLEIKPLNYEEIDWAKKRLGILDDITSKNELKKAYQRQAVSTHPDRNPNMPGAGKEFDEVNKSYKILTEYCEALEQAGPVRDEKSLSGTSQKENTMLVRIRG